MKPTLEKPVQEFSPTTVIFVAFSFFTSNFKYIKYYNLRSIGDFPGGPVVKNPPSSAGDLGSIPGRGTKIPHAAGQLSPDTTTTELVRLDNRARVTQTTEPTCPGARAPQLERENPHCNKRSRMPELRPDTAKT